MNALNDDETQTDPIFDATALLPRRRVQGFIYPGWAFGVVWNEGPRLLVLHLGVPCVGMSVRVPPKKVVTRRLSEARKSPWFVPSISAVFFVVGVSVASIAFTLTAPRQTAARATVSAAHLPPPSAPSSSPTVTTLPVTTVEALPVAKEEDAGVPDVKPVPKRAPMPSASIKASRSVDDIINSRY